MMMRIVVVMLMLEMMVEMMLVMMALLIKALITTMMLVKILIALLMKSPADLVIFTEEILNGKLHFFCSGMVIMILILIKLIAMVAPTTEFAMMTR